MASADGRSNQLVICDETRGLNVGWSPTGRFIAHIGDDGSLRLLHAQTGQDELIDHGTAGSLTYGPARAGELRWSPAGDMLAYMKFDPSPPYTRGVWTVSPDATPVAVVQTPGIGRFYWSPDGSRIVYEISSSEPTRTPTKVNRETGQLFLVNADGSGAHKLTDGSFVLYSTDPWSPDGRLLAYWRNVGGGSALSGDAYAMDVDSGREVSLGALSSDQHAEWSPARDRYVFYNLAIDIAAQTATPLFDPSGSLIDWSPDGTKVAYVQHDRLSGEHSLVVLDAESGKQTVYESSSVDLWVHEPGYRGDWSPDGRYYAFIAYEATPGDTNSAVTYVADTGSGAAARVVVADDAGFVWYSPDGSLLLIQNGYSHQPSVWVANRDGSAAAKLVDGKALARPFRSTPWLPAPN